MTALVMGNPGPVAILPHTETDVGNDVLADFEPVSMVMSVPIVLNVRDDVPARTVSELVALIRTRPDSVSFRSSGIGRTPHMAAELLQRLR